MINRNLIRIKVVQLAYAYYQNGYNNLDNTKKELLFSISKAHDLYLNMLLLILAIQQEAESQWELEAQKAKRTRRPLPSRRFVDNAFTTQLRENIQLREEVEHKHFSWENDAVLVHNLYKLIMQTPAFKAYMTGDEPTTYDDDRELWRKLYKRVIAENEDIDAALEEKSLYWNDDKVTEDTFVLKTIRQFQPELGAEQPLLGEYGNPSDQDFAIRLMTQVVRREEECMEIINSRSKHWDLSRLTFMDRLILQIAITEMLEFPDIAVQVTINEYIDIARFYSTPKSAGYINGMLDAAANLLAEQGRIQKPVRAKEDAEEETEL